MKLYNKIHIYLRMFSRNRENPDRPDWFSYEKTFRNLLLTADKRYCNLTVCFDKEEDFATHFIQSYQPNTYNIKFIETESKRDTFFNEPWSHSLAAASEVVDSDVKNGAIKDNELIYVLEDDYLHVPGWPIATLDAFNHLITEQFSDKNDIICLYDHRDKYLFNFDDKVIQSNNLESHWGMYKNLKSQILISAFRHWRSVPNCGLSMIMPKSIWERDREMWLKGYSDCEIGHQVVKNYQTRIWTPMPALNTHCINPFVAPLIDWKKYANL